MILRSPVLKHLEVQVMYTSHQLDTLIIVPPSQNTSCNVSTLHIYQLGELNKADMHAFLFQLSFWGEGGMLGSVACFDIYLTVVPFCWL